MKVIEAYKTDSNPQAGNISEEVLVLEDGSAVYMNPTEQDEICSSKEEAFERCEGEPRSSDSLLSAWSNGYEIN